MENKTKTITYADKLNLTFDNDAEAEKFKTLPNNIKTIHSETINKIEGILSETCDDDKTDSDLYNELNRKFDVILKNLDEKLDNLFEYDNPNHDANNKIFGSFIDPRMKIFYFHMDKFIISKTLASYLLKKCEVM